MFQYTKYLLPIVAVLLAGNTSVNANPVVCRVDNTQPFGTNAINKPKVEHLGFQTADNSCSHRDLGFTGAIAVHDLNLVDNGRQRQLVPFNSSWGEKFDTGFGGTSLVEINPDAATAAVFYLVNQNSAGYWWPAHTNPRYGDIAAFRDPRSDFVYVWDGPPTTASGWVEGSSVYLVRVKASEAFDLSKYQYWWGLQQGWMSDRLTAFTSETATLWGTGQGQVVWSEFHGCYIFVRLGIGGGSVFLRTASRPEGPWSMDPGSHPYLDESGKMLVLSFTNNNRIQVIKATFSQ
ncbi:hypothetical protein C8035_v005713 [Colletotrichum spinosum]|uniref:DUF4185 domain-containing protein n=1 Tax=Colletotrichum spinosum TaxID=1347390 RepID=A0A4R8QJD3_9PEZI|nr:hypothetical protein C8035_v005713 [Colletotrichum spinosum]